MNRSDPIYVSGHGGMLGSAIVRALHREGFERVLVARRDQLDLLDQRATWDFFAEHRPKTQIICAAIAGGIGSHEQYPADFIGQNLIIQTNLFEAARRFDCQRTVFIASSCVYPQQAPQPLQEDAILTGPLAESHEWYAIAKLAGIQTGRAYRQQFGMDVLSLLPANPYGPNDNFDKDNALVLPALMRRFHEARQAGEPSLSVWGTGRAKREFIHSDDVARAVVLLLNAPTLEHDLFNLGAEREHSIAEASEIMRRVVGFDGAIEYDDSRPDGQISKRLDSSRLTELGWRPTIGLEEGLQATYDWFRQQGGNWRSVNPGQGRLPAG